MFSLFLFTLRLSRSLLLIQKKLDELRTPLCIVAVSGYHRQPPHDDGDDDDDDDDDGDDDILHFGASTCINSLLDLYFTKSCMENAAPWKACSCTAGSVVLGI